MKPRYEVRKLAARVSDTESGVSDLSASSRFEIFYKDTNKVLLGRHRSKRDADSACKKLNNSFEGYL